MKKTAKKRRVVAPTTEVLTLDRLTPDAKNANQGTTRGRAMVETSVRRYGMGRSVLADKHGRIIAGNKTFEAAGHAGIAEAVVVDSDGTRMVVVRRTDLDLDTDIAAKELAIADNQASAVGLSWRGDALINLEREGADVRQFFRAPEWSKILKPAEEVVGAELPEMEIQPFEHHDYIMVVFRDSHTWTKACDLLNIGQARSDVKGRRKIGLGRVIAADRLFELLDKKGKTAAAKKKRERK